MAAIWRIQRATMFSWENEPQNTTGADLEIEKAAGFMKSAALICCINRVFCFRGRIAGELGKLIENTVPQLVTGLKSEQCCFIGFIYLFSIALAKNFQHFFS